MAGLLALIALLAIAPWKHASGHQAQPDHVAQLDLATANSALAAAAPGAGVSISHDELVSSDYPSNDAAQGAYPPAPSYAKGMTPEWHTYAAMVDRVCALSYNYMLVLRSRARETAYARRWTETRAAAAQWSLTADEDARILQATQVLGQPPAEGPLFASWRANVARRTALFRQASRAARAGDFPRVQRICARINRLKADADELGQRFGLRICTSN